MEKKDGINEKVKVGLKIKKFELAKSEEELNPTHSKWLFILRMVRI